jgi:glucosylceramidase
VVGVVCAHVAAAAVLRHAIFPPALSVRVVQSSANLGQRLTPLPALQFSAKTPRGVPVIHVDDTVRYQSITGFGAAMTDSSAWIMQTRLTAPVRAALYDSMFGPTGINMTMLRVPMGATDFTVGGKPYSYDDQPRGRSDPGLQRFTIAHDLPYVIPALQQALARNPHISMLANPWSPPGWMKTNGALDNNYHRGALLHSQLGALASYFVKFIQAYARAGIPISALTPQNEPGNPTSYPGMELPAAREAKWTRGYLLPALAAAKLHPRIYGNDQGWSQQGSDYVRQLRANISSSQLSGIAWHCYFGSPDVMGALHAAAPKLEQTVDECSPGILPFPVSEVMISSLRKWASSVVLFNLALDTRGGPVQPPNQGCGGCTGLAKVDSRSNSFRLMRSYYELGQVSKFIRAGAQRIKTENFVSYRYTRPAENFYSPGLDDVAARNRDGSIVVVAYNNARRPISFAVQWRGRSFAYTLAPGSTVTFSWRGA